jgi:hypothetical protein
VGVLDVGSQTVEEIMRKRLLGFIAVTTVVLGGTPAAGYYSSYPDGREPAYLTTLYSDASHTTVVGHITPECGYQYVQYSLSGTYSQHGTDELVGYCTEHGWAQI